MLAGSAALGLSVPIAVAIGASDRHRRQLLPADDPRVSPGRRLLHRHARESRPVSEPRRGRGAAGRLRAHRRRERRGRHRGAHVGDPAALPLPGDAVHRRRHSHRGRKSPRRARVGPALRAADLSVPRRLRPADRLGGRPVVPRGRPPEPAPAGAARRRRGADRLPGPPGLLVRVRRPDGDRGRLRRRPRLPPSGGPERPPRAAGAGRHPHRAVSRHLRARACLRRRAGAGRDGELPARPPRLRGVPGLLPGPGRDHAHPRSWPPTRASRTSRDSPRSSRGTASSPASSRTVATGSPSRTAS